MTASLDPTTTHATPPPCPSRFATVTNLGRLLQAAQTPRWSLGFVVPIAVFAVMVLGFLAGAFIQRALGLSNAASAAVITALWIVSLGLTGFALGRRTDRAVAVYEGGMAAIDGATIRVWPWAAIDAVSLRISEQKYEFPWDEPAQGLLTMGLAYTNSARKGSATAAPDHDERRDDLLRAAATARRRRLGSVTACRSHSRSSSRCRAILSPRSSQGYEDGEAVSFGAIRLSRTKGIETNDKTLPWVGVAGVSVGLENVSFGVRSSTKPMAVPRSQVRNALVLERIVSDASRRMSSGGVA